MAHGHHRRHDIGDGPLIDDPDGLLALPKGFEYKIVAQSGVTLRTGVYSKTITFTLSTTTP